MFMLCEKKKNKDLIIYQHTWFIAHTTMCTGKLSDFETKTNKSIGIDPIQFKV